MIIALSTLRLPQLDNANQCITAAASLGLSRVDRLETAGVDRRYFDGLTFFLLVGAAADLSAEGEEIVAYG